MEGSRVKTVAPFVEITPDAQLDFDLPTDGSKDSTCKLSLKNISSQPLLFKIKTTAPKEYCVRPNSGFIPAGESADVQVILQGPLPRTARKKDKFLVQTALLETAPTAQDDLNQLLKDVSPDLMQEVKLRCQWNFGDDESAAPAPAAAAPAAPVTATPATAPASVPEPKKDAPAAPKVAPAPATDESGPVPTPRRNKATAAAAAASATPGPSSSSATSSSASSSAAAAAAAAGGASSSSADSASRAVKKSVNPSAVAKPSSSSGVATAVADNENKLPSMVLLIVAFILGVILGKFVW